MNWLTFITGLAVSICALDLGALLALYLGQKLRARRERSLTIIDGRDLL